MTPVASAGGPCKQLRGRHAPPLKSAWLKAYPPARAQGGLVPLLLVQGRRIGAVDADVAELRREVRTLSDRVARIEGESQSIRRDSIVGLTT